MQLFTRGICSYHIPRDPLARLEARKPLDDLFHVPIYRNFPPDMADLPLGIDDECAPDDPLDLVSVHLPFPPGAVAFKDVLFLIGEEGNGEEAFLNKVFMAFRGVRADAEDNRIFPFKFIFRTGKIDRLDGSAGGVIPRIKKEHDPFAQKVRKGNLPPVLVGEGKAGSHFSYLRHGANSFHGNH